MINAPRSYVSKVLARLRRLVFLLWFSLLIGAFVCDWSGINAVNCLELTDRFFYAFLPAVVAIAFGVGLIIEGNQLRQPSDAQPADNQPGAAVSMRTRWLVRAGLYAFFAAGFSIHYTPIAVSYLAKERFVEEVSISRVSGSLSTGTFCYRLMRVHWTAGVSRPVCVKRHRQVVLGITDPNGIEAGDRLILYGRRSSLGAVVDRFQPL